MIDRFADLATELRQRRAVRFILTYAVGAWIAAQVAGFFVEQGYVSRRVLDVTLFLLVVFFLALLVLVWYHGEKGHQKIRRTEAVLLGALGFVAVGGSVWLASREASGLAGFDPDEAVVALGDSSLAVLPFVNELDDPGMAWLDRGIADLLATDLTQLPHLRVVSGQRLFDLLRQLGEEESRSVPEDLQAVVTRRAGARYMLTGRIAGSSRNLVLIATLADARTGEIAGAARAQGPDVFTLVDRISSELLPDWLASPGGVEQRPVAQLTTRSLEAYAEYQRGREARLRFHLREAEERFRAAIALDSTFALAHFQLAGVQATNGDFGEAMVSLRLARENLTAANEHDRLFIEGLSALIGGDRETGERKLRELITKYPDEKEARLVLANFIRGASRDPAAARQLLEEALQLDPMYAPAYNELAYYAARRGDFDSATVLIDKYVALEPDEPNPLDSRGEILELAGRTEEARAAFGRALALRPDFIPALRHLVRAYLNDDLGAEARQELASRINSEDVTVRTVALELMGDTHFWDGQFQAGFDSYERAAQEAAAAGRTGLQVNALRGLLMANLQLGRYDRAEAVGDELRALAPSEGSPYVADVVIAGERGRVEEVGRAVELFDETFGDDPNMAPFFAMVRSTFETYDAFYRGDYARAVEAATAAPFAERGSRTEYLGYPVMRSLLALEQGEEAVEQAGVARRAGIGGLPGDFEPITIRILQYFEGRARELSGDSARARAAYERLIRGWGDAASGVPLIADVVDRLARLRA